MKWGNQWAFLGVGLSLVSGFADANSSPVAARLVGNWNLEDFVIISPEGKEEQFCTGMTGQLLYTVEGQVSVSINCLGEDKQRVPTDDYGGLLFYSGTFKIQGDEVAHTIQNASEVGLIGKNLLRKVEELSATHLVLTGNLGEEGKTLRVLWNRPEIRVPQATDESVAYLTHLKLRPGTQEKFFAELKSIIGFSRSEPGNIAWYVQQSLEDPTEIVFYTRWIDQGAIEWHLSAPPLVKYIQNTQPLLAEPVKLRKYRPVDLAE